MNEPGKSCDYVFAGRLPHEVIIGNCLSTIAGNSNQFLQLFYHRIYFFFGIMPAE
jgi:hypothetical protein